MNNNDITVSCKSLARRVRRRSPTTVVQDITTQEFDTTMTAESNYVDFHSKINDIVDNQRSEEPKLAERRTRVSHGAARRSRPDAKGMINGKECHAFAFAAMLEEDIADDL